MPLTALSKPAVHFTAKYPISLILRFQSVNSGILLFMYWCSSAVLNEHEEDGSSAPFADATFHYARPGADVARRALVQGYCRRRLSKPQSSRSSDADRICIFAADHIYGWMWTRCSNIT